MTIDEVLYLLHARWKKNLTPVQELILRQAWQGNTYTSMAQISHYEADYIRNVASQLWRSLSELFGAPINKANFRSMMNSRSFISEQLLLTEGFVPPASITAMEFPSGPVPLNSNFYIERPPIEALTLGEIAKPGSLVQIRAPRKMGKSSLLLRLLSNAAAQGYKTVMLDFQRAEAAIFDNLDKFLRWFCTNASWQLQQEPRVAEYWNEAIGSKVSCTIYLQHYLLAQIDAPLVLVLSELNPVFEYPGIAREWLGLLRSWHEEAQQVKVLQKLRLVVTCSSETCVTLPLQQSLNIGLPIDLPEFTLEQVQELALRYGLDWSDGTHARQLMALVGGHPYLVRVAFYHLCMGETPLEQLLQTAPTLTGIYQDHLHRCWMEVQADPELRAALKQAIGENGIVLPDPIQIHKLKEMGLVKLDGDRAIPRCELYRLYFGSRLDSGSLGWSGTDVRSVSLKLSHSLYEHLQQVEQEHPELQHSCSLDRLTYLADRSHLIKQLEQEWRLLAEKMAALSLILCSLDDLNHDKTTYGNQIRDRCLQQVASTIRQVLKRPADLVARYRNQEFAVLLPHVEAANALYLAGRIQEQVRELALPDGASLLQSSAIAMSFGVASAIPNLQRSPAVLLAAANQALHQARRKGREAIALQRL